MFEGGVILFEGPPPPETFTRNQEKSRQVESRLMKPATARSSLAFGLHEAHHAVPADHDDPVTGLKLQTSRPLLRVPGPLRKDLKREGSFQVQTKRGITKASLREDGRNSQKRRGLGEASQVAFFKRRNVASVASQKP